MTCETKLTGTHSFLGDMNWSIVIYGTALLFAIGYYIVKARHEYEGPVNNVKWQARDDSS